MDKMKFLMPNRKSIYLHNTPVQHLFQRAAQTERSCYIRLEKQVELAAYLLNNQEDWSLEKIELVTTETNTETISLRKHTPVYLVYRTTWVDDDETI